MSGNEPAREQGNAGEKNYKTEEREREEEVVCEETGRRWQRKIRGQLSGHIDTEGRQTQAEKSEF